MEIEDRVCYKRNLDGSILAGRIVKIYHRSETSDLKFWRTPQFSGVDHSADIILSELFPTKTTVDPMFGG